MKEDKRPPRYEHDCKWCVYLGRYRQYDLYVHPPVKGKKYTGTVIARWSSEPSDYSSGICFRHSRPALGSAFERAKARGILTEQHWEDEKPVGPVYRVTYP